MKTTCTQKKPGSEASRVLGVFTTAFAVLGPIVMIIAALVLTLAEGDWWFNLFLANLGGIFLIFGSPYVSLVTFLWELCCYTRRNAGMEMNDTPVSVALHWILLAVSAVGLASVVPLLLILMDLINGGFAWIHLACGGALVITLVVYGVYSLIRRRADHHRAEAERLNQEKKEWEGYLS